MNAKRRISLTTLFILSISIILLFGCQAEESKSTSTDSSAEKTETETETSSTNDNEYPIVIEHAFGEAVIEEKPERVATIQWANHDVALALGVVPVGFSAANYGVQDDSGLLPWTAEKLEKLGVEDPNVYQDTDGLDFEAISDSNPDVILASYSGITQEDYDILSEIAPVVAYQTSPWITTWREQVIYNSTGMGMKEEGEQLISDTENLIKEKVSEYPEIQGKTVAFANFSADDLSTVHVYTPVDPRGAFLIELGMEYPESIKNEITDPSSFSLTLSAENADILNDADILIGYGDESLYKSVKEDPLLGKIPAIERGSVVFIGNNTPLAASGNPNPLAIAYTIDEYLELIGGAIEKIDD
ncbi:iron-siderophore ABC transporter substrate-binding protein [Aquibacillus saliphilus]|uniref:iron-siderophore ABC transporter substrate-binding protein n=1 Tax=Aquibacillus saliphilus TaxID=1909422 RepID=UPI001CF03288|nr:iron-siderophore ABC transporter substrate-binding protein [Aquibacillus saliphilus]